MSDAIQVGDWVQVIQSEVSRKYGGMPDPEVGKIFQIKEPRCDGIYFRTKDTDREYWPCACLRKLSDEEIADRLNNQLRPAKAHELMKVTYNYPPEGIDHGFIHVSCPCGRSTTIDLGDDDAVRTVGDRLSEMEERICRLEKAKQWTVGP